MKENTITLGSVPALIPPQVMRDKRLNCSDKILFGVLVSFSYYSPKGFSIKNETLNIITGMSQPTISGSIRKLAHFGWLACRGNVQVKRIIILKETIAKEVGAYYHRGTESLCNMDVSFATNLKDSFTLNDEPLNRDARVGVGIGKESLSSKEINIALAKPKARTRIHKKENPLMEYWNKLPHTRTHDRKNGKGIQTETYTQALRLIKKLQKGSLAQMKFDPQWFDKYGDDTSKQWKDRTLKNAMDNLNDLFDPSFWPQNKTGLPRDLPKLIYNPRSQKSLLIQFWSNPPETMAEYSASRLERRDKTSLRLARILTEVLTAERENAPTPNERKSIIQLANRLKKLQVDEKISQSSVEELVEDYADHMKEYLYASQNGIGTVTSEESACWQDFLIEVRS